MPEEVPAAVQSARSLMPVLHFIESNLSSRITAEDMSRLCLMSPFRFSRTFKEAFGVTFRDYLLRTRLVEAARLLENPQAQVADVACAVGFNDMSHFGRMFKRHFGVTPSAAQEAFQGNNPAGERAIELPSPQSPRAPPPR
jgi:transcriptional regulator GlxA family with amidase domain